MGQLRTDSSGRRRRARLNRWWFVFMVGRGSVLAGKPGRDSSPTLASRIEGIFSDELSQSPANVIAMARPLLERPACIHAGKQVPSFNHRGPERCRTVGPVQVVLRCDGYCGFASDELASVSNEFKAAACFNGDDEEG